MPAIDREFTLRILEGLVSIDSINPALADGSAGEAEVAAYVAGVARDLGLEVAEREPEPGRISVVAALPGHGGGRCLMLNAHSDTVGIEGMEAPFLPRVEGGRLYGRGAYDMKGALAACLGAAKALRDAGVELAGDLLVAAVADEEYASLGTTDLIARYAVDGAIVTEPSELELCLAHKGFAWLEVTTHGHAAHGSQFREGIDANLRMGRVLSEIEKLEGRLRAWRGHPLVGPPSLHAATLAGGVGPSTYAERCTLTIERRTVPGESEEQVVVEIQGILDRLAAADPTFRADLEVSLVREPFEVDPDAAIVRAVAAAAEPVLGRVPNQVGENPWMDSALLAAAGVETVIFGPSGGGAHAREEWVDLESVYRLAEILAGAAIRYCGVAGEGGVAGESAA